MALREMTRPLRSMSHHRRRWPRRAGFALLTMLLLLILGVAGTGYYVAWRSLPTVQGELQVAGLGQPVTVYRDARGVPHIFAQSEHDLYFAQGYVTAQDRLWQMDLSRRAAAGRLSEVMGEATLDADRFFRSFSLYTAAEASLAAYSEQSRAVLAAYADGVNAFIDEAIGSKRLPPEFILLGYAPEPWTAADSASIGKFMAYDLGGNWKAEVFYFQLAQRIGLEKTLELMPAYPPGAPVIMDYRAVLDAGEGLNAAPLLAFAPNESNGSNNWVLAGSRTASGKPLLANDPHLGLRTPSIWYATHLEIRGAHQAIGVTFPGAPGVVVGRNQDIAWGVTNLGPDMQDLFLEIPNPVNPREFLYEGRWEPAQVRIEHIRVKGKDEPVVHEVLTTRHGPIISAVAGDPDHRPTASLALQWTALAPTTELAAVLAWNRARNWTEFREALRQFEVPAQNFVFAATDGTIAYRGNGRIPIRRQGDGLFPRPGWQAGAEWQGYIPWERLPEAVNPPAGFIGTANARVVDDRYPYFLAAAWAPPYRTQRIHQVLAEARDWTVADMQALQTDVLNLQAQQLLPLLLPELQRGLAAATAPAATGTAPAASQTADTAAISPELVQQALAVLTAWDCQDLPDTAGPAVYHAWYRRLQEGIFSDEMGDELYKRLPSATLVTDRLLLAAAGGQVSDWFDDVHTPEPEDFPSVLATAFRRAVADLAATQGKNPARWSWGKMHRLLLNHPLGSVPGLGLLLNVRALPVGGSGETVAAASYPRAAEHFNSDHSAPWRQVVDLADPADNSWDRLTPGQSGHFLSPWYRDQADPWATGTYARQVSREDELTKGERVLRVLRLLPVPPATGR